MAQSITHILPRHVEIMRRLVLGESQRDIATDMGLNEGRLSIIVNSPLFQLELRKMQRRQEDRVAAIHEKIIEGAEKSITLHNQIIDGHITTNDVDGTEMVVVVPLQARQQSATAVSNLFLRLTKGSALSPIDEDGEEGYESRLEKEVTFRETTTTKHSPKKKEIEKVLDRDHPTLDMLERAEEEALEGMM